MRQDIAGILGAGWIDGFVAFLDVLNDSVFVDYERRAITIASIFVEDAVLVHDRSFEIAEQRKGDPNLFCELAIGINAVNADAENLCVGSFEFGDISLIRLHLLGSTTSESKYVKGEHDILFPFEVAELVSHGFAIGPHNGAGQGKIRGRVADFEIGVRRFWFLCGRDCRRD